MDFFVKLFCEGGPVAFDGGCALSGGHVEIDDFQHGVGIHHLVEAGENARGGVGCFDAEIRGRLGEFGNAFEFNGGVFLFAELFEDVGCVERGAHLDERFGLGGGSDGEELFAGLLQIAGLIALDEGSGETETREIGGLVRRMLRDGGLKFGDAFRVREFLTG